MEEMSKLSQIFQTYSHERMIALNLNLLPPQKKKGIIRGDNLTFRESPCSFQNLALSKSEISVYKQRHFSFILMTISNISIVPHLNQ